MRKRGFDPVVDAKTRVLVLGSLPGDASLAAGQYYAHPRNAFWRLIGSVIEEPDLADLPYPERLNNLLRHHIGLWDVIVEAERVGSLDSAIRLPDLADLNTLMLALPDLRAVAFNGGKSANTGLKHLGSRHAGVARVLLPSSSPAHARPLAAKAEVWSGLKAFLAD